MQHRMILYKVFLMLFPIFTLFSQPVDQIAYLNVQAENNLHIYLNGHLLSRGSFDSLAIQPGTYTVHAYNMNNSNWQDRGEFRQISIKENANEVIRFAGRKSITVFSHPPAGEVYLNGRLLGHSPISMVLPENIAPSGEITILRPGYLEEKFTLIPGMDEYTVDLKPLPDTPERRVYRAGLEQGGFRWSREGLVITSLATSWIAFFLKREADRNYDNYIRSSDPRKLDLYYNRTRTLDTYAEISVGVSVLALGTYFYYLLTD